MRYVVLKDVNGHAEHAEVGNVVSAVFTTQDAADKAAEALAKGDEGAVFGVYYRVARFETCREVRKVEETP